ncbi:MAG: SAM-dependent methyltransferase [Anaerolineales bacterium]|nr:SAM-dependent methyltransferase [Anaerolineales bacterium]
MTDARILQLLLSSLGQEALAAAHAENPAETDFLPLYQRLSRRFPAELARAAIDQVLLRERARAKFSNPQCMYFTRQALEQATPEPVAIYRATRLTDFPLLFDLGCGIGGDTLSLAQTAPVVAVDQDRLRLLLLKANARGLGIEDRIKPVCGNLLKPAWWFPDKTAVFFDPSRRAGARRRVSVKDYRPPLHSVLTQLESLDAVAVKVSPAVAWDEIDALDCEIEFVSLNSELKEATLWFRALMTARRRATILPGPHSLTGLQEPDLDVVPPQRYLYEPDPAILRARLVRTLGAQLNASLIDMTISLLTTNKLLFTPFARTYRVLEVLPFGLKRLRAVLRARDVGTVTLKKRGSAVDTSLFLRQLKLRGENQAIVLLTRVRRRHVSILMEQVHEPEVFVSGMT